MSLFVAIISNRYAQVLMLLLACLVAVNSYTSGKVKAGVSGVVQTINTEFKGLIDEDNKTVQMATDNLPHDVFDGLHSKDGSEERQNDHAENSPEQTDLLPESRHQGRIQEVGAVGGREGLPNTSLFAEPDTKPLQQEQIKDYCLDQSYVNYLAVNPMIDLVCVRDDYGFPIEWRAIQ